MLLGVAAQFFLAGVAIFRAKPHGTQRFAASSSFDAHRTLGNALIFVALLILIAAMLASRQRRRSAALFVLMTLQSAWTAIGSSAPAIAALHVLGAFAIAILAYVVHRESRLRSANAAREQQRRWLPPDSGVPT
ncbi:MAG TPA: DUF6220 domain-containing protein [Solirubrobacteraceae bacterium]|nr:DUF6220 domain-containing protein [Solirubrobacteraceae bacterium]